MRRIDWIEASGRIVDAIGTAGFPATLSNALREIAPFDFTVVFGYVGSARPLDLYDDFPKKKRRVFVEDYQEGPYLLDPFFLATTLPVAPGLWRMREIAPDRFYQGEYFRNYYIQTGLAEEIGYFVKLTEQVIIVVSLMRADRAFSAKEIRSLREVWPIVGAACRQHWRDVPAFSDATMDGGEDRRVQESIARAFQTIGQGILTPRERQVVEYTLKGHSADAVGKILGIAPGTVRIHRRNIYLKLRISSQGELFSEFIRAMLDQ
ncbi:helix-turn-helix transcriptional regulator [Actibacterium sp. MT2.3-13A]|uniref:helix-turn-helix transcriptional regulator n=1 Tax=Actibacterium sp. MT2.3-13A TaxID=2828332 RepID=UPI001BAD7DE1|nr:helix-turn-helix transcriptional regulator [Actibacterium sp. MT2.3-13A]